eukprot:TRINITY_DN10784_c0_g1_i1.p1 TRINITY_DN10784_c0_g1~~TRINITY_DN10784_c0_g1_i1.p1  ORF type:complete len:563 (+),score=114.02 TRINITY_DN10784_c0_g1_i1:35-1690(+)
MAAPTQQQQQVSYFSTSLTKADYKASLEALASLHSNASVLQEWTKRRQTNPDDTFAEETLHYARRMSFGSQELSKLSVIHVAGTKGKGSTCAFAESILRYEGVKTGLYISPHLVEPTERIRINGKPLTQEQFAKYFWKCWDDLQRSKTEEDSTMPGFFRFLTLMAFRVFMEEKVDATILEVGIGGRTDATNIIEKPVVCGVTSIGYDHMEVLGDTLGKIAYEKAGIFKRGVPAFTVPQVDEAMQSFINVANKKQATLYMTPSLEQIEELYGKQLKLGLDGSFQKYNAALAVSLSWTWLAHYRNKSIVLPESLLLSSKPSSEDISSDIERFFGSEFKSNTSIAEGLENTKWAGRCQTVPPTNELTAAFGLNHTTIYLDGAHTPESSEACITWFNERTVLASDNDVKRVNVLVFNCFTNRDPKVLLRSYVSSGRFDYGLFVPVVRAQKTSTAMEKLTTIPTNTSWQQHTRSVWLELLSNKKQNEEEGGNHEDIGNKATVLSSLEEVMEKLKSLEDELKAAHKAVEVRVLITGSVHLVGGMLGLFSERGVPDLL